jgi:hypothetical protein
MQLKQDRDGGFVRVKDGYMQLHSEWPDRSAAKIGNPETAPRGADVGLMTGDVMYVPTSVVDVAIPHGCFCRSHWAERVCGGCTRWGDWYWPRYVESHLTVELVVLEKGGRYEYIEQWYVLSTMK